MRPGYAFKSKILKSLGYIPENTFAMWDYNAGRITLAEMWRIINRNISRSQGMSVTDRRNKKPRRGDQVILNWMYTGEIDRIQYDEGNPDLIYVSYQNGDYEEYEYDEFIGKRSTVGGPNRWFIEY